MKGTPAPKEQARLLAGILAARGLAVSHQQALDIVARLHGWRAWGPMKAHLARARRVATAPDAAGASPALVPLLAAARDVADAADATGCSDDLTVTSAAAVEALKAALAAWPAGACAPGHPRRPADKAVGGFGVGDVLGVRPDLTEAQALEVLEHCEREFDASVGMNWDILGIRAGEVYPAFGADAWLVQGDVRRAVFVRLHSGAILDGHHADLARRPASQWQRALRTPAAEGAYLWFGERCTADMGGELEFASADLGEFAQTLRDQGIELKPLPVPRG